MNINGQTKILVTFASAQHRGQRFVHTTRVLGTRFNRALKRYGSALTVSTIAGAPLTPSKGASWEDVAAAVREGKSFSCSVPRKSKKANAPYTGVETEEAL